MLFVKYVDHMIEKIQQIIHSANADVIANVKSKIIVSRRHFFADVILSGISKVRN